MRQQQLLQCCVMMIEFAARLLEGVKLPRGGVVIFKNFVAGSTHRRTHSVVVNRLLQLLGRYRVSYFILEINEEP